MSTEHLISNPTCPRCRYDLSGATASWSESCPCIGRCPECGLDFDWADLLRSDRQRDDRFIEHTRRRRRIPGAAIRTWARSFYPPGFWSWIKLHHETSVRRMVLWVVLLVVPLWAAQALCATVELFVIEHAWSSRWSHPGFNLSPPVAGQTRSIHYSPFHHYSTYLSAWTQPAITWEFWRPGFRDWNWIEGDSVPQMLAPLIVLQIAWPLMVAVLRTTLGNANVHWKHIFRACIYSTAWMVPFLIAVIGIRAHFLYVTAASPNTTWGFDREVAAVLNRSIVFFILAAGFMLWTAWWWYTVIVGHWRLQHGRIVWMVLLIPVSLISFVGATVHKIWQWS